MSPIDDRMRMKAAIELSAPDAARGHEAREPSDPKIPVASWPPPIRYGRPGDGNPSARPDPSPAKSKATVVGVWAIITAFLAAAGAGWAANQVMSDRVRAAEFAEYKKEQQANWSANNKTMTDLRVDVGRLQERQRIADEPKSLTVTPEKKENRR